MKKSTSVSNGEHSICDVSIPQEDNALSSILVERTNESSPLLEARKLENKSQSTMQERIWNEDHEASISKENDELNICTSSSEITKTEDISTIPISEDLPPLSVFRLICLTICFLGVQFGWAIQIAYTSPLFLELGVPKSLVSFVWLAGPISGLLVQPVVGVISDKCTVSWGRRKPFILFGALFIVVGMLLISNASDLGSLFGDTSSSNWRAIFIAIVGFWILDLSNNTVQGPCRALLVDIAPSNQQNLGGSLFSFMLGLGNLAGYFCGSQKLTNVFPFLKTDLRALFTIGMVVLLSSILITVTTTKEKPFISSNDETDHKSRNCLLSDRNPFVRIFKGILTMPKGMKRVCMVQFFTWVAWFTFLLYITTWVGENIFHGDPDAEDDTPSKDNFNDGVRAGAFGLSMNALVTMVMSLILPYITKILHIRPVYFFSLLVLALCLMLTVWVESEIGAIVLIAAFGIPWTVTMVFPFTLVAMCVHESESGMYMGVLNIFVVIPQICVSVGIGSIINIFDGNLASALATGGCSAVVAAILVWSLIVDKEANVNSFKNVGH